MELSAISLSPVQFVIQISGQLASVILKNVTGQSAKKLANTSHIERSNNTMRQKNFRLVRSTLFFSKARKSHWCYLVLFIITMFAWASYHYIFTTTRWKNGYKEVDRYIVLSRIYGNYDWENSVAKEDADWKCQRPDWLGVWWWRTLETNRHRSDECPDSLPKKWLDWAGCLCGWEYVYLLQHQAG